ncbi:MAG: anti-sigma factor domain-containing protein [Blastocatellia bacterium]
MTWDEVKELGPLYAIGALNAESAQAIEDFLRLATVEQRREFAEWSEIAAMLPLSLAQASPSSDVKDSLMAHIANREESVTASDEITTAKVLPFRPKQRFAAPQFQRWLLAASILLAFSSVYLVWQNYKISGQLSNSNLQLSALKRQFEEFLSPSTRVISMNGVEVPGAHAKVVWNLDKQTWEVHIKNLPAPPSGKDYQLWYVTKDAKINAAVFSTGENGNL